MTIPDWCICVPARNEAARLPALLEALAAQSVAARVSVVLCVNNSDDDSVAVAAAAAARWPERLELRIDDCRFAPDLAHAGSARARAMATGLNWLGGRGVLISTDADCRPPQDWIAAILVAMAAGANIVGGRIILDEGEPIDPMLLAVQARYDRYWALVREIEDAIDPSPHDPPPRHGDHTGASLAIDAALFAAVGGVPIVPTGEDRALVAAAVGAGGRLAHPPSVWTRVSARTEGRAAGGMAAAMAARKAAADPLVPDFAHWRARASWRRQVCEDSGVAVMLAQEAMLPPMPQDMALPGIAA